MSKEYLEKNKKRARNRVLSRLHTERKQKLTHTKVFGREKYNRKEKYKGFYEDEDERIEGGCNNV